MAITILLAVACGEDDATSPTAADLIGTWVLVSVNGVGAPAGTLTWTISATTITAESGPEDCVEVGTYTMSGNTIKATTTSFTGQDCASQVGDMIEFTFDVTGDTLTAVIDVPETGTGTFVFERA